MARSRIHIENLRIRLPRSMRHQATAVGWSIAHDVTSDIAATANGRTGAIRIDEVPVGRVKSVADAGKLAAKKAGGILNDRIRK